MQLQELKDKKACRILSDRLSTNLLMKTATNASLLASNGRIWIHSQGTFIKGHRGTLFTQEAELVAFVFVDFLAPGRFDGLDMNQVAGFTNQIAFVGCTVLNDDNPLEVDAEILNPFLDRLLNTRIESFQTDLVPAAVLVGTFEFLL